MLQVIWPIRKHPILWAYPVTDSTQPQPVTQGGVGCQSYPVNATATTVQQNYQGYNSASGLPATTFHSDNIPTSYPNVIQVGCFICLEASLEMRPPSA